MKDFKRSIWIYIIFTVLVGIIYPLLMTGISMVVFPFKANGSLIQNGNKVVGSELIGQSFSRPEYFHGRPSALNYDAGNSGGTNFGPTNQKLIYQIDSTARVFREENGLAIETPIPADIVTSSASGLDPHISLEAGLLQIPRISKIRGLEISVLEKLVNQYTERPFLGIIGKPMVNVLKINLALDSLKKE